MAGSYGNYEKKGEIVFRKEFGVPDLHLEMRYMKAKEGQRKILYFTDTFNLSEEELSKYEDTIGIYCMKCGHFQEHSAERRWDLEKCYIPCDCAKNKEVPALLNVNGRTDKMHDPMRIYSASPHKLIITEHGKNIHLSIVFKNWLFNPKAIKPFAKAFHLTIIINTETGQTYIMPATYKGKRVFGPDSVRTASFQRNDILDAVSEMLFEKDEEAMTALNEVFARFEPTATETYKSLTELVRANYLKELQPLFEIPDNNSFDFLQLWKRLKRRYCKDPETFPKYLYYGCTKVATKSIRKILYKYPEQKWTLQLLYKVFDIKNPDIIRQELSKRHGKAFDVAMYLYRGMVFFNKDQVFREIKALADAVSDAGFTDKEKVRFFLNKDNSYYHYRDTASMYALHGMPTEELRKHKTLHELHDNFREIDNRNRNKAMYERYNVEIPYSEEINALDEVIENAEFRVVRRPWDQKKLGEKLHNCLQYGSYMEDAKQGHSIIVEMLLNGKITGSIELDGAAKEYRQAYAACNQPLEGDAAHCFNQWAEKHGIKPGRWAPHVGGYAGNDIFEFAPGDFDGVPF